MTGVGTMLEAPGGKFLGQPPSGTVRASQLPSLLFFHTPLSVCTGPRGDGMTSLGGRYGCRLSCCHWFELVATVGWGRFCLLLEELAWLLDGWGGLGAGL